MAGDRWVKVIKPNKSDILLTDIPGLHFLEWNIPSPVTNSQELELTGIDGVLPSRNTYGAFDLELLFYFAGTDSKDLNLFSQRMKSLVNERDPFYIVHSDMPRFKYAVNSAEIEYDKITVADMNFTIKFHCYKGYAESLYSTKHYSLSDDNWQFQSGLVTDEEIKYTFHSNGFKVFNGGDDEINPLYRHNLKIYINVDAPNGFTIRNKTNGTSLTYKGSLKKNRTFVINGIYSIIDNKRVGKDTDYGIITLEQGYNDIEIDGTSIGSAKCRFDFNFIYR